MIKEHQEGLCRLSDSDEGVYEAGLELAARSLFAIMFYSDESTTSKKGDWTWGDKVCGAAQKVTTQQGCRL
jgi:hypothetical protein